MYDRDTLLSMGFAPASIEWALRATRNAGLQPAMDHLLAHAGETPPAAGDDDDEEQEALADMLGKKGAGAQEEMIVGAGEAKSIKCLECGKILKSAAFASFHAEKSGHTNFEESTEEVKPLTEEEKRARLAEMRAKLEQKRALQAKESAEESKANEKIRRKAGQDLGELREEMQKKEAIKEAEKRKAEAKADAEAKRRVREQIEADKRERAARTAREKALRDGTLPTSESAPVAVSKPAAAAAPAASTANEARLRVRAPGGMWMGTLSADSTLRDLEKALLDAGKASGSLQFSTTFPRKTFSGSDASKTLRELGLVPNAALEASAV